MHRSVPPLLCLALLGCGPPNCPPPKTELPKDSSTLSFNGALPIVSVKLNGTGFDALLDTGFDRSAVSNPDPRIDLANVTVELAGAKSGPSAFDILIAPTGDNVIGNEILHQLPIVFDRPQGKIEVHPEFLKPTAGYIPLLFTPPQACRNEDAEDGAGGPFGMLVSVDLEGTPAFFLLDTGSDVTFARSTLFDALTNRPKLEGIRVATAFAGNIIASAVRAKELAVDVEKSPNALILSSPSVDKALDELGAKLNRKVDGLLGQTFLREFRVDLRIGENAGSRRGMKLTRSATQTHYKREFIGVGIYYSQVPTGLKVDAFLTPSPAQTAGVQVNDIITQINGQPAVNAVAQLGQGSQVTLNLNRAGTPIQVDVPVQDLVPDPP